MTISDQDAEFNSYYENIKRVIWVLTEYGGDVSEVTQHKKGESKPVTALKSAPGEELMVYVEHTSTTKNIVIERSGQRFITIFGNSIKNVLHTSVPPDLIIDTKNPAGEYMVWNIKLSYIPLYVPYS